MDSEQDHSHINRESVTYSIYSKKVVNPQEQPIPLRVLVGMGWQVYRTDYFVGVGTSPEPVQVKSRGVLAAPAVDHMGFPWSSVPVCRTVVTDHRITCEILS